MIITKLISKSKFQEYLICPKDAWFRLHELESDEFEVSLSEKGRMEQGNIVERYAKELVQFYGFVEVKGKGFTEFKREVDELMLKKVSAIYQPSFVSEGFICRCDFLVYNSKTKKWDIYEVKGTNSLKDADGPRDHISDITFQTIVLESYGVTVGDQYIVHLNNKYIRRDNINIKELFVIVNCTEQVVEKKELTAKQMDKAKKYLNQEKEPREGCDCLYYCRGSHCETISKSHPEIPEYSIHDLSGIRTGKLTSLIKEGIYHLHDIEDTSSFSEIQQNQIHTHKTDKEIINKEEIVNILDSYNYPLYFFDYETFAPAVPIYPGYKTYQRIPIQFSLHIIDKKGDPVRHVDYLHQENSDPSEIVAQKLNEYINPKGTILAWNYSFEKGVTEEIAERLPKYEPILSRICKQMKDLRDIFSKQHYVHKDFRGSSGVEAVMNVLLPKMSYDHLPYHGDIVGYVWWSDVVNKGAEPEGRDEKIHLIKEYCKQDTFVMVEIFRILNDIINKNAK